MWTFLKKTLLEVQSFVLWFFRIQNRQVLGNSLIQTKQMDSSQFKWFDIWVSSLHLSSFSGITISWFFIVTAQHFDPIILQTGWYGFPIWILMLIIMLVFDFPFPFRVLMSSYFIISAASPLNTLAVSQQIGWSQSKH